MLTCIETLFNECNFFDILSIISIGIILVALIYAIISNVKYHFKH